MICIAVDLYNADLIPLLSYCQNYTSSGILLLEVSNMSRSNQLGKRILLLRKQKSLTQKELANKMHLSFQAVSKWERGETIPDINTIYSLCKVLRTDFHQFMVNLYTIDDIDRIQLQINNIGKRMKEFERVQRMRLLDGFAVIQVNGKTFKTFTKGLKKPYDPLVQNAMEKTMKFLCENIPGAIRGYTHSDKIHIVVMNESSKHTPLYGGDIQKTVSSISSMATIIFNQYFQIGDTESQYKNKYYGALFDVVVFNLPGDTDANEYIELQRQTSFHNALYSYSATFLDEPIVNYNPNQIVESLRNVGITLNSVNEKDFSGSECQKQVVEVKTENGSVMRKRWIVGNGL